MVTIWWIQQFSQFSIYCISCWSIPSLWECYRREYWKPFFNRAIVLHLLLMFLLQWLLPSQDTVRLTATAPEVFLWMVGVFSCSLPPPVRGTALHLNSSMTSVCKVYYVTFFGFGWVTPVMSLCTSQHRFTLYARSCPLFTSRFLDCTCVKPSNLFCSHVELLPAAGFGSGVFHNLMPFQPVA